MSEKGVWKPSAQRRIEERMRERGETLWKPSAQRRYEALRRKGRAEQ